ncbi:MAG: phosphonate ABC transporter, permease protein PhnE [Desulfofustis sp.]|jgi:phosphonate transport system permease protein
MSYPTSWNPPTFFSSRFVRFAVSAAVIGYFVFSYITLDADWARTMHGIPRAVDIFQRMIPPDFSRWNLLMRGVLESIQMAFAASFFGMLIAIPVGLCAANNLVPKPVYYVGRAFLGISRTFHEIIVAIFFVKIFGFGPLAGVLTLIVASFSFIGKMLAEDIENMKPGKLEAIRATGASFPKLLIYAVQPQVLPRYIGVSIYRLDANIRHSTVVGIVGAGGIGQTLAASFSRYDYGFSLAILITIVSLVFLGEFFSNWVRGYLR